MQIWHSGDPDALNKRMAVLQVEHGGYTKAQQVVMVPSLFPCKPCNLILVLVGVDKNLALSQFPPH